MAGKLYINVKGRTGGGFFSSGSMSLNTYLIADQQRCIGSINDGDVFILLIARGLAQRDNARAFVLQRAEQRLTLSRNVTWERETHSLLL